MSAAISGCGYTVEWLVEPAVVENTLREDGTLERYVAITEGDCSTERAVIDPSNSARLADGEEFPASIVAHGRHCFWSLQVRRLQRAGIEIDDAEAPCRLEAIGSIEAQLPTDAPVVVREEIVSDAMRPRWDGFVRTLAQCAPQRDPSRCTCPYSVEADGACAAPVRGSLFAAGTDHVCTALLGATLMTCWGNEQGWLQTDTPRIVGPTRVPNAFPIDTEMPGAGRPIAQLEAGAQATCIRAIGGKARCLGTRGAGYNLVASGNFGGGMRDITVGADFACGLNSAGVSCRGGPNATRLESAVIDTAISDLDAGDAHLCWLANGHAGCVTSTGAPACPNCTDNTWTQIAASAQHTCGIREERLFCWDLEATSLEGFNSSTVATSTSERWVCATGGAGLNHCGAYPGCGNDHRSESTFVDCSVSMPSTWGLVTLGTNFVCASIGDSASVHCSPLERGVSIGLLGRSTTTIEPSQGDETSSVCPYPNALPL